VGPLEDERGLKSGDLVGPFRGRFDAMGYHTGVIRNMAVMRNQVKHNMFFSVHHETRLATIELYYCCHLGC
jgi:hypothetical protein